MKKLYYTIGEVSEMTNVKQHVLRYWESQFPDLKPAKNKAGKRVYTDKDIEVVLRLRQLIKGQRFSTAGARQEFRKSVRTEEITPISVSLQRELKEIRHFLASLQEKL
jgi:DNA-binding transcriptional MerR regulator